MTIKHEFGVAAKKVRDAEAARDELGAALKTAGVQVKDINVTLGGRAFWHAVISIRKQPGEGKNALLAALSVMDLKHVVVVDDDIDVFNPTEVEWAIATRVQGDRDVMIVTHARGKPLAPDVKSHRPTSLLLQADGVPAQ